ncbi:MAG TPA: sugar efflux transporter [Polyangiaceae bacterium]|nr:sugar efflux transporter [Polyangiaceae bacterium]
MTQLAQPRRHGGLGSIARHPRLIALLASSFLLGSASSFVVPFMSLWGTVHIGMTALGFGLFMTSTALSSMVLSLAIARWSDTRASRRSVLLVAGAGGVLGYAGYASVEHPWLLALIGASCIGLASASFPQLFAHAREELARPEYADCDAATTLSTMRAAFALAWTFGPAIGASVVQRFGYRGTFGSASALFAIHLCIVGACVPGRVPAPKQSAVAPSFVRVLSSALVLRNFAAFVLVFTAIALNLMNLPLFLTRELGGTEREVGIAFAVAPLVEIPLMLWFGRLAARGHQVALIRGGVSCSVLYFIGLLLAGAPANVYALQVLNAAAVATTMSVAIPYFQDLLPGQAGVATSIYTNSFSLGSLLGYLGFGVLVPAVGHRNLSLVCALLGALSLAVLMLSPRRELTSAA